MKNEVDPIGETISPVTTESQSLGLIRIVPHERTLRKAREQIKVMVKDGVSPRKISLYQHRWGLWWMRTSGNIGGYMELLRWFLTASWDLGASAIARQQLNQHYITA